MRHIVYVKVHFELTKCINDQLTRAKYALARAQRRLVEITALVEIYFSVMWRRLCEHLIDNVRHTTQNVIKSGVLSKRRYKILRFLGIRMMWSSVDLWSVNVFCCEIVTWITIYLSWRRSNTLYFVMKVLLENKINLMWYLGISTKNPRSPLQTANTATANFVDLMCLLHTKIVSSLLTCKHSKQRGGVRHYQNKVKHSSLVNIRLV